MVAALARLAGALPEAVPFEEERLLRLGLAFWAVAAQAAEQVVAPPLVVSAFAPVVADRFELVVHPVVQNG